MREADIRPLDILTEYLRLSAADAERFFDTGALHRTRPCPACDASEADNVIFRKNRFDIALCGHCGSLFVVNIPTQEQLTSFYEESKSQKYWAKTFFPVVAEARREKIFRPRAERIKNLARDLQLEANSLIDVGCGAGIFLEEVRQIGLGEHHRGVEPTAELAAETEARGFEVFHGFSDQAAADPQWNKKADLVVSFEVLEHIPDSVGFFTDLANLAAESGLIVVSGLSGAGFDISVLGEVSPAVSPPHHLNFLSPQGVEHALTRAGLEAVDVFTPGELDVDIVRNVLNGDPDIEIDPFIARLVTEGTDESRAAFQSYLSAHRLSSHMWVVARKARRG